MLTDIKNHILYEDDQILVLHKPAGIPVQTVSLRQKDLVSLLKNYRAKRKEEPYIGVVHRLDQPVEGVILFAKTKEAAAKLSSQSAGKQMDKWYRAVVYLKEAQLLSVGEKIRLENYLIKDGKTNTSKVVEKDIKDAKRSALEYEVLRQKGDLAELQIQLETGRHHQIRVQMAHAGMPLVGDQKYGVLEALSVEGADKNVALCSVQLAFVHPKTGKRLQFEIEPQNKTFSIFETD